MQVGWFDLQYALRVCDERVFQNELDQTGLMEQMPLNSGTLFWCALGVSHANCQVSCNATLDTAFVGDEALVGSCGSATKFFDAANQVIGIACAVFSFTSRWSMLMCRVCCNNAHAQRMTWTKVSWELLPGFAQSSKI